MSQEKLLKTLTGLGLTPVDSQVYIFLAKKGTQRARDIAKSIEMNKQQLYRSLTSLQSKGLLSSTLEYPARFTAVSFDKVLDLFVKTKMEEAQQIQQSKSELLSVWQTIQGAEGGASSARFMVLEGRNVIYSKILQMVQETKKQLYSMLTAQGLARAELRGLFDAILNHPFKSAIEFRFLTELYEQNLGTIKTFLKRTSKANFNLKVRNPDLGLQLLPRLVVRDEEEIVFFITRDTGGYSTEADDTCLWTNCASLVQAFTGVFQDLWRNSTDIEKKISEIETGKPTPKTYVISDADEARTKYDEMSDAAKDEIVMLTSPEGLSEVWKNIVQLKERVSKGVSIKILAPITSGNLEAAIQLSKCCEVRHFAASYLRTTVIDNQHLFQFRNSEPGQGKYSTENFANTFYTNDSGHVEETRNMLNEIWENARAPSAVTLEDINKPPMPTVAPVPDDEYSVSRKDSYHQKNIIGIAEKPGVIKEKDVLNKLINAKRTFVKDPHKDVVRLYGSMATAVVHPPNNFNLPDMMIMVFHLNKQSSFGATDWFSVNLWLETPRGYAYVPVAHVADTSKGTEWAKVYFGGTPAGQNIHVLKKDELQVQVHGNTLFAGWTVPIPLFPPRYILPPAVLLVEGYGRLKTSLLTMAMPSGATVIMESNGFDAFGTLFHPASKYAGPGTEATIGRDIVVTAHPPSAKSEA